MSSANPIERSLELAAVSCEDLTPLVYARLHRDYPQTRAMFRTEGSEPVKGSMLALTLEAILDLAGERSGKFRMIECEISSHDAYGTPRELFIAFFGVDRSHAARTARGGMVRGHRGGLAKPAGRDRDHGGTKL